MKPITRDEYVDLVDGIVERHDRYWKGRENVTRLCESLYDVDWWSNSVHGQDLAAAGWDLEQTDEGYTTVESSLAQVFVSSPGLVVQADPTDPYANAPLIQTVANNWVSRPRMVEALKQAARWALVYPWSALILSWEPSDKVKLGTAVTAVPAQPWEILIDWDAKTRDDLSYIGRIRTMTVEEATGKFGKLRWLPKDAAPYTDDDIVDVEVDAPDQYRTVCVYEFYDLRAGKLVYVAAKGSVDRAKRLLSVDPMPLQGPDGRPVCPILPLHLGQSARRPMLGSSLLERMAPALVMKNWLLTMYARRSKRASTKTLVSSRMGEDAITKLTNGILDEVIPVEAQGGLDAMVRNIGSNSNPQEWNEAFALVQQQIDRSVNLPAFARGQATRTTATEVLELQSYASSLIGLTAWQVNDLIRNAAQAYLSYLSVYLDEDDEVVPSVLVDSQPEFLTPEAINAEYRWTPVESIASPLGGSIERRNLLQVLPVLTASPDVDKRSLVEHLVRTFDLPLDLLSNSQGAQSQVVQEQVEEPLDGVNVTEAMLDSTMPANVLGGPTGGA